MKIQKLPLAERIRRHKDGRPAYPEYIPGVIRNLAEMPVADYLAGLDPIRRQRLFDLIGCPGGTDFTYQWAAKKVLEMCGTRPEQAAEAMRILAAPMIRYDDFIRKQEETSHA